MINEKIEEFINWSESIKVDPVIKSLNKRCQEIEEDTLNYIYRKNIINGFISFIPNKNN